MKRLILRTAMFLFCCFIVYSVAAQDERHSGLLLTNGQKTKLIRLGKKVKICAGEENKVYQARLIAVDDDFAYLSTGQRLPIKSIKSIRHKRILLRDVGSATVATGSTIIDATIDAADEAVFPKPTNEWYTSSLKDDDVGLKEGALMIIGGVIVAVVVVVGVSVITITAGTVVGLFEPTYSVDKWTITPFNPLPNVIIIKE